jgi:hypothetical protein
LSTERVERRLTAILAADVAGYSRLMGADEEGTLAQLKAHRKALVDPKIAEHRGRIVKITGDGMLVEFASVVDALRCAVEVQRVMAERNAEVPQEKRFDPPRSVVSHDAGGNCFCSFLCWGLRRGKFMGRNKSYRGNPHHLGAITVAAASNALAGKMDEAQKYAARALSFHPGYRVSRMRENIPLRRPEDYARFEEGLRKAGLPE